MVVADATLGLQSLNVELDALSRMLPGKRVSAARVQAVAKVILANAGKPGLLEPSVVAVARFVRQARPHCRLAGLYVADAVTRTERQKPTKMMTSEFEKHAEAMVAALSEASDEDRRYTGRLLGEWAKHGVFEAKRQRLNDLGTELLATKPQHVHQDERPPLKAHKPASPPRRQPVVVIETPAEAVPPKRHPVAVVETPVEPQPPRRMPVAVVQTPLPSNESRFLPPRSLDDRYSYEPPRRPPWPCESAVPLRPLGNDTKPPLGMPKRPPPPHDQLGRPPPGPATPNPKWQHHLHKTRLCRHYLNGSCPFGDRCNFAHGQNEIRQTALSHDVSQRDAWPPSDPVGQQRPRPHQQQPKTGAQEHQPFNLRDVDEWSEGSLPEPDASSVLPKRARLAL